MITVIVGVAAYVAGCLSPGIGRKLKAAFAKSEVTVKADVQAAEKKL